MEKISVVVPCYNEEESISLFYGETSKVLKQMKCSYEIIFVDDGSKDRTLEEIKKIKDKSVKYISFSRNFGKEAAMYAGLSKSTGDYVCTMDVDLQDPPKLIPEMYDLIKNHGYDCVATRRVSRAGEPPIRSFFARLFYKLINKMMDDKIEIMDGARDFRLMKRSMVNAVLSVAEHDRFSKGIFSFVGFKTKWLEYENIERVAGVTKWSFFKLCKYAISGIISFSTKPLLIPFIFSFITIFISIILFIILGFSYSIVLFFSALLLLLFGIVFICLGIMGMYLSRNFVELKNRPIYIVREEN